MVAAAPPLGLASSSMPLNGISGIELVPRKSSTPALLTPASHPSCHAMTPPQTLSHRTSGHSETLHTKWLHPHCDRVHAHVARGVNIQGRSRKPHTVLLP